jgi:hypothetical protein
MGIDDHSDSVGFEDSVDFLKSLLEHGFGKGLPVLPSPGAVRVGHDFVFLRGERGRKKLRIKVPDRAFQPYVKEIG